MIRTLAALALMLCSASCAASCAGAQTPPAPPSGDHPGERHFPRNERIVPLQAAPDPSGLSAAGPSAGALAYAARCKGCHEPATAGAPDRVAMAKLSPEAIVASLTASKVKIIAHDVPAQEMREVATFLTGKTMPATSALPEARP